MEQKQDDKVLIIARQFVVAAINGRINEDDCKGYQQLLSSLEKADDGAMNRWITALTSSISLIDVNRHSALVKRLMDYDWRSFPTSRNLFSQFLLNLVSVNPDFLVLVLKMLVINFLPPSNDTQNILVESQVDDVIHSTLSSVLKLHPTATRKFLFSILEKRFPHHRNSSLILQIYVKNLLRLTEYSPEIRFRVLNLITERLLQLDALQCETECKVDKAFENDNSFQSNSSLSSNLPKQTESDLMFQIEMIEIPKISTEPSISDSFNLEIEKFDALMTLLFQYLSLINKTDPKLIDEIYQSMLRIFESQILVTNQSNSVPFIMFYLCSFKQTFAESFISLLLKYALQTGSDHHKTIICLTSITYLSSFISHASFLHRVTILHSFHSLIKWALEYVDNYSNTPNINQYVFYYICQALFYIFIWRQDIFFDMIRDSASEFGNLKIDHLVESSLEPLSYCSNDVVSGFLNVGEQMNLFDKSYIESRLNLNTNPSSQQYLSSFLSWRPYSRYSLPHSARYLQGLCRSRFTDRQYRNYMSKNSKFQSPSYGPFQSPVLGSFASPILIPASDLPNSMGELSLRDRTPQTNHYLSRRYS